MMNNAPSPDLGIRVSAIQRFSLHDGPGIRTTVFLQGCPLRCPWCANPETQDPHGGRLMSVREIMDAISRDADYYRNSGGGVTFSGGEAFMQGKGLLCLLRAAKEAGFHTAVETSGAASPTTILQAEPLTDLFLFDIKHCNPNQFKKIVGGSLAHILSNLKLLAPSGKVITRIPCIPGFNLDEDTMKGIFEFARSLDIHEAHLLPYHTFAKDKYTSLGREFGWSEESLKKEDLNPYAEMGERAGLTIKIGG